MTIKKYRNQTKPHSHPHSLTAPPPSTVSSPTLWSNLVISNDKTVRAGWASMARNSRMRILRKSMIKSGWWVWRIVEPIRMGASFLLRRWKSASGWSESGFLPCFSLTTSPSSSSFCYLLLYLFYFWVVLWFLRTCLLTWSEWSGKHVVFGEVVEGLEVVKEVESKGNKEGRPPKDKIIVSACGAV